MGRKAICMLGKTIGKLTIQSEAGKAKNGETLWKCVCACGNSVLIPGGQLRNGHASTCGKCLRYEPNGSYMVGIDVNGEKFLFDSEDWGKIKDYGWWVGGNGYVCADDHSRKRISLHRLIMNPPGDLVVDHVNGYPQDCRKSNLRIATKQENAYNAKLSRRNTTGYKGVYYDVHREKYEAYIRPNGVKIHLGRYSTAREAARAYNAAASRYFGRFARLNVL